MKRLFPFIFLGLIACTRDKDSSAYLPGVWVNVSNDRDTLRFTQDQLIRAGTSNLSSSYSYSLHNQYITLQYTGPAYILVQPKTFAYRISSDYILSIDSLPGYFPRYAGSEFRFLRK